ncbi:Transcriptional regulatory protein OmpR [Methylobacterium adhaesivum]|jgi:two-component system phosphate regulon response regulator OmpR|uniref:Response regulator n=1 Tax=Methylobacterium adhaesivum TaxID=333297 RepID=A0ABT8BI43_9HYPH|nr:response regulator [Methylobacterium adhaesivum]MDN3590844.1 response regulator [Methylobacterium adhaesivum]GJD29768.1 Transcriptional regulatory protein OmpR [Methylobacterium adhaesivum]
MTLPGLKASVELPDHAPHILVVDDDRRVRELLTRFLYEQGFRVTAAANVAEARSKAQCFVFDALVLDVMMPGETGFDYARQVRETSRVPILMLTARSNPNDRVMGLEIGADDYLPKPFEPRELILRLNNIIKRRTEGTPPREPGLETVTFGPFSYRIDRGELRRDDETIRITEREREILTVLAQAGGANVEREALAGAGGLAGERSIDVQINRLRRKTEVDPANPLFLQTVRGVGYRLAVD